MKLIKLENLQYFSQNLWNKIKDKFMTKEDAIDGILVGQEWTMLESVVGNSPIALSSTDSFTELYIEMYSPNGTITHQQNIRMDSILFDSDNKEYREILLDSIYDAQTYVKYDFATNSIIPVMYEGNMIDSSSEVTTRIYTKTNKLEAGKIEAEKIAFDNSVSNMSADNVQGAIDEVVRTIGYTVTSKNLLPYPYFNTTLQSQSVHFTDNGDGTVTINGTATGDAIFQLRHRTNDYLTLKADTYTVTGVPKNSNGIEIRVLNSDGEIIAVDEGNGDNLTINETENIGSYIFVANGTTVNNLVIEPMISKEGGEYEPYVADVQTQINEVQNNVMGIYYDLIANGNTNPDTASYKCEYDGYLGITTGNVATRYGISDANNVGMYHSCNVPANQRTIMYIKKGMRVYCEANTDTKCVFMPFIS